jgi:NAD(P)-dependent dehydrogenase (short-subunit alcohol dehydrogenase family)
MAPFGVKVVTVAAGTVETNIFRRSDEPILPADSLYKAAEKEIQGLADGSLVKAAMPPAKFAKKVVDDVLGGATGTIWRGKFATVGWFMFSFMPSWLIVSFCFFFSDIGVRDTNI